jgi:CubicO group peptidase (beta-lactamase class C family)
MYRISSISWLWVPILSLGLLYSCSEQEMEEEAINRRPVIDAPFAATAYSDSLFVLDLAIEDPDEDELMVSLEDAPGWLSLDEASYQLSGTPSREDVGASTIKIIADDGLAQRTKEINIQVVAVIGIQEKLDQELFSLWQFTTAGLTGVSAAVVTPNGTLIHSTAGDNNPFDGGPISPNHQYRIASVTKTFTAALILRLAEEGLLSLDDPLFDYFPIPELEGGEQITIRHMLNHTSGLADHLNDSDFWSGSSNYTWEVNDIADYAVSKGLSFEPGQGYAYSNTGFYLLEAVIESATQLSLAEAYQQWVFTPLNLEQTLFDDFSNLSNKIDSLAANPRSYEYHLSAVAAAGAIVSTPRDVAKFGAALYGGQWLQASSLQEMTTDYGFAVGGQHYGLGTRLWDDSGYVHHGHTGSLMDYRSILMYVPAKEVTIVICTNDTHDNWFDLVNGILVKVAGHY